MNPADLADLPLEELENGFYHIPDSTPVQYRKDTLTDEERLQWFDTAHPYGVDQYNGSRFDD